jgi:hypothetical protein
VSGVKRTLARYVTDRVEPTLNTFNERVDGLSTLLEQRSERVNQRLTALEDYTNLPGANPLKDLLVQRYTDQLERQRLTIHSAVYGVGNRSRDVTTLLRNRVKDNTLTINVENDTLGGDPAHGVRKVLTVDYSIGDESIHHTVTVNEHKTLQIG